MSIVSINTLKQWFSTAKKPTQEQFWDWIDSFRHINEKVPSTDVDGLQKLLDTKVDKKDIAEPSIYNPLIIYFYDAETQQYVSFSNPNSQNSQFQSEAMYRLIETAPEGENPETNSEHWAYQGVSIGDISINDVVGLSESLGPIAGNTNERHSHANKTILDKFSFVGGKLLYDGGSISNMSINDIAGLSEALEPIAGNTGARHTHENIDFLEELSESTSITRRRSSLIVNDGKMIFDFNGRNELYVHNIITIGSGSVMHVDGYYNAEYLNFFLSVPDDLPSSDISIDDGWISGNILSADVRVLPDRVLRLTPGIYEIVINFLLDGNVSIKCSLPLNSY